VDLSAYSILLLFSFHKFRRPSPLSTATITLMDTQRLWLTYPAPLVTKPVICDLAKKFPVSFNIRQASVNDEMGLVSLELQGERDTIKSAITWLEEQGVKVEPVEINTIEG